jgi:hypothetical protein
MVHTDIYNAPRSFGFVYIWCDSKRKMYYIGSHIGTETDGYVCSSKRMRQAYLRRPETFKRRILYHLLTNDRSILLQEEKRWLDMIKDEELSNRYYNVLRNAWGLNSDEIAENCKSHWKDPVAKENHKKSMRKAWTPERKKAHSEKLRKKWESGAYSDRPYNLSEENREKLRYTTIKRNIERTVSDKTKEKMSQSAKKRCTDDWSKNQGELMRKARLDKLGY